MAQTITVRFVCNILEWNWTNIHLSHNFPNLTPLSVNCTPKYRFTITMGNAFSATSDFYCLTSQQQREIIEACMLHESFTWATKDREFLANLNEIHKNGTAAPTTPAPQNQGTSKHPKVRVTTDKRKPVAFPSFADTPAKRVLYTEMMQAAERLPDPTETHKHKMRQRSTIWMLISSNPRPRPKLI